MKNGCVEENLQKSTIYRKSVTVHQKHGSTGHVGEAGVCLHLIYLKMQNFAAKKFAYRFSACPCWLNRNLQLGDG